MDPDGVQRNRGRYPAAIARIDHSTVPRRIPGGVERAWPVHHRPMASTVSAQRVPWSARTLPFSRSTIVRGHQA